MFSSVPSVLASRASSIAHARPAGPAPTIRTSSSMRSPAPGAPSWRISVSRGSAGWYWAGTILSMQLADLFSELGDNLEEIDHDAVVGHFEDRRFFVLV